MGAVLQDFLAAIGYQHWIFRSRPVLAYRVPPVRDPGRPEEWSVTVNYGLMLTSGAKTKVTTRFLVKNYPYDMFGRYSRYRVVT